MTMKLAIIAIQDFTSINLLEALSTAGVVKLWLDPKIRPKTELSRTKAAAKNKN
jgi:hypothetical protein